MKQVIKLPLFLGIVGGLCGGLLALTNYFTAPKIEKDEALRVNAAYLEHFTFSNIKDGEITDTLAKAGVTAKKITYDASEAYIGTIYNCTVAGFGGDVKFTVSYKDGKALKFIVTESKESKEGSDFLAGLEGDKDGSILNNLADNKAGSTTTYNAVSSAMETCLNDYLSEYKSL